jgi:hypothetical protein
MTRTTAKLRGHGDAMIRTDPSPRTSRLFSFLLLAHGSCVERSPDATQTGGSTIADGTGGSSGDATTGGATPTTSGTGTGEATSSSSEAATGSSGGFLAPPDVGPNAPVECDVWEQDCPEGQKCAAWAEGGGSAWNALKCVPVTGDQLPGEPCTAEGGGVSGLDDCVKGAMCWDVDARGQGTCVAQCVGSPESPQCAEPGFACPVAGDGVLALCFPECDPLAQDCLDDDLCLPISGTYLCIIDASGDAGAAFDACEYVNVCDKGLLCLAPAAASECDQGAQGCCLPMCSIADGGAACPGAGQECLAVYEPPPEGHEDVGYCSLP